MEGIVSLVILVTIVWYLGSAINSILSKAGVMASDEFDQFRRSQKFRIKKDNIDLKNKVKGLNEKEVMTDAELDAALGL